MFACLAALAAARVMDIHDAVETDDVEEIAKVLEARPKTALNWIGKTASNASRCAC